MSNQTLSVVIITLNEEHNIRQCLESIRWADEIIVVDSDSADGTLNICKEFGCQVVNHAWEGYARQKNFAVGLAKCDWVLSMDADEEITSELTDEMRHTINSTDALQAYSMPRKNLFLGKWMRHGGWYPDRQIRLFKRGAGKFKEVPIHEHLVLNDPSSRVELLKNPMMHYTYPSVSDFIHRADAYTNIEVDAMLASWRVPKNLGWKLATTFPLKMLETYIYKAGWRDGVPGLIAATLVSGRVFTRYAKLWQKVHR